MRVPELTNLTLAFFCLLASPAFAIDAPTQGDTTDESTKASADVEATASPAADALLAEVRKDVERLREAYGAAPKRPEDPDWVRSKLDHMVEVDQLVRRRFEPATTSKLAPEDAEVFRQRLAGLLQEVDGQHLADFKEILEHHRWITISAFGDKAAGQAWLLAQHADQDRPFQKRILAILEELLPENEVQPRHFAYLYDRVAGAEERPQRFGTQGRCAGPGTWEPLELEDPDGVDARRESVGLEPMEVYKARFKDICP